ncbi:hypothetical protein EC917_1296 [Bacillus thuringiensis]|uniref:Uncharacterized protein n=1 Tax=Bacillus thuringiensis TaxID=1428 RepID=A0A4V2WC25_BACTU|nr:hypothetical protein EC917_1296 [Bacillus thuringiensis]TCW46282.1 hypothetical protein EC910_1286 [Bacillus thuringiensis]
MPTKEFQDTVHHFSFFLLDKGRKPSIILDNFRVGKPVHNHV